MPDIAIVPAPRELTVADVRWITANPVAEAIRDVVENLDETEYRIDVTADGARLTGGSEEALRYAEATYGQLLDAAEPAADGKVSVPGVHIADAPRFAWRGVMLDVARHFMPKDFVFKVLDVLALHRMNVLHFHLTDDQGWRVEIEAYPKLTEVGAWRNESMVGRMTHEQRDFTYDGVRHGGFYTKADLREIVAYAAERGITVVPEIDLPGHMQAAIAAYPELGNFPNHQLTVRQEWGISDDVLNVNDETVEFVRTVLREVLDVFPSPYVHLGGDECPSVQWHIAEKAQKRQADLGLEHAEQLQGWFTAQVASVLEEEGRRLVGWDEMVDTDCPKDAVIMAWRSAERGEVAVKAGHQTVMTPSESVYFDYYQGDPATEPLAIGNFIPLEKVYDFEVIPAGLSEDEAALIIGTQCNVWTEYMPDEQQVGYMLLPRLSALAERAWGSPKVSYDEFLGRLRPHLERIEALGVNYRPLD